MEKSKTFSAPYSLARRLPSSNMARMALPPAAILAILFGLVIDLLQKKVTPRGLRKEAGR